MILTPTHRMRSLELAQEMIDQLEVARSRLAVPKHRDMLDVVMRHIRCESIVLDLEGTMATMVPEPVFRFYGVGARPPIVGNDAVRRLYEGMFSFGRNLGGVEIERLFVDDDAVLIEGLAVFPAAFALIRFPDLGAEIEPDRVALVKRRTITIMPFVDMKMTGEEFYVDGEHQVVYLD
jgi:hypothetical protein